MGQSFLREFSETELNLLALALDALRDEVSDRRAVLSMSPSEAIELIDNTEKYLMTGEFEVKDE